MDKYNELLQKVQKQSTSNTKKLVFPVRQTEAVAKPVAPPMPTRVTPTQGRTTALPDRKAYQPSTQAGYQQALQGNAGARFHAGVMEGLSPVSMKTQLGERYGQETLDALKGSTGYKAGNIAGVMGQFAVPYAGATPKIGSALSKIPQVANMGKVGQTVARSVATDLAVGLPLNVNYAFNKEDLEGKEALKSIGINTAIDLVAGGVLEVIGGVLLKSGRKVASKADFDALPKSEQAQVLEEVSKREVVRRPLKQQERTIEKITKVPTEPATYAKIEREVKANVNKLLSGAKPELRTEVRNLIPSFTKGETGTDEFLSAVYDAAANIPYAKAGDKELLTGVRAFLKKGIKLTDDLRQIPDFRDFRIANAGKIKFSPDGSYVDVLYDELSSVYGGVFPSTITHPVDQLQRIISVLDDNKAETIRLGDVLTDAQIYDDIVYPVLEEVSDLMSLSKTRAKVTETVKGFPRYKIDTPVNPLNRPVQPRNVETVATVPINRDLGADIAKPTQTIDEARTMYGTIEPGMEPRARDAQIPKAINNQPIQQGIRTSAEARAVNDESYQAILSAVEDGMAAKVTVKNRVAVENASKTIAEDGLDVAYGKFKSVLDGGKQAKSEDIALGYRLMQEYQNAGDYGRVSDVAIDVSEMLSETGRSLQAATIIKKLSPEGRLMSAQRIAKKLSDRLGKDIRLDDETIDQILKARTEAEIAEATQKAGVKIWNQVPSGLQNKANAWRYMSMLMNPKTHIRNIVGNLAFMPARGLKNIIGTGLEKISRVEVGQRTKAIINPLNKSDQALLKLADKNFGEVRNILRGEAKYDDTIRPLEAKVFNTKILEAGRKLNLNLLDGEDIFFMRAAYDSSFAQYMKANKIDINNLDFTTLQKARNYAADEALKATYRDYNKLASSISKLKHNLATSPAQSTSALWFKRGAGVALEGVLPFTKTPMNLLRRGVEYSPWSLATGVNDMLKAVRSGKVPPAEAIDRLAAGMSGTSILLLGMLLQRQGIVVGGSDNQYSSKQYQWETMTGMQEYAIDTGDGTYTLDWAAPMSMPFFVGVELSKMLGQDEGSFVNIADAITAIDEPIFNMSMLQGINQALNAWSQSEGIGGALGEIGFNMALSYAGQFVPTVGGQIARTLDGTRRVTTSTNESATVRKVEREARRQGNKNFLVPLLKDAPAVGKYAEKLENEPYIDLWGRKESSGGAFQNFISPGYYRPTNETKVDKEIGKLIESLDPELAKDVIPRVTNSYTITQDKVDYRLSEKELTRFKEVRGKESYDGMNRLINSSTYQKMSPEEKVKAIKKVYDSAYDKAKEELLKKRASMPIKK